MNKGIIRYIFNFIFYSLVITLLYNAIIFYIPQKQSYDETIIYKTEQDFEPEDDYVKELNQENYKSVENTRQTTINQKILEKQFPNHYLARAITGGKIIRWNPETFPLTVYIEHKTDLPEYFYQEVKSAFSDWQKGTKGYINFKIIDSPKNADIRCYFPKNDNEAEDFANKFGGITHSEVQNNILKYMTITFSTKYKGTNKYYNKNIIRSVALHEIGHALGILGHSVNPKDIMYPSSSALKNSLSTGDISTIKLIYSIVPDISNKNFSQEAKDKFMTIADIFGNDKERIELELANTMEDSRITVNDPNKIIHIGNLYYKKNDYKNAIKNYNLAIVKIHNDNNLLAKVNYNLALSYMQIKEYEKALSYANESQKLSPNDKNLELAGKIYYRQGDNKAAEEICVNLLNKNPKAYDAYIILANIYKKEKNAVGWNKLYEMGKENFPDNPPLRRH